MRSSRRKRPPPLFSLAIALACAAPLRAQIVVGTVVEDGSKTPVEAAVVTIVDPRGTEVGSAVTDSVGWFRARLPAAGTHIVRVNHLAFATWASTPISIERGETVEVEIRLGRTVIPLEPLVVTARGRSNLRLAEYRERLEKNAFGRFVTREEIDSRLHGRVTDFLRTIAGVSVVSANRGSFASNLITMRGGSGGRCMPALYIDGVPMRQSPDFPVDELLVPEMLEGVEVYMSTAVPVQYASEAGCGAVLFWTREPVGAAKWSWKKFAIGVGAFAALLLISR